MTVVNPSGGGTVTPAFAFGTAAARPAPAAGNAKTAYYATDTNEITYSDGAAWNALGQTSIAGGVFRIRSGGSAGTIDIGNGGSLSNGGGSGGFNVDNNGIATQGAAVVNTTAAEEAATATAGGGGALPATVQGYIIIRDHLGTTRKIPYYAN